MTRAANNYTKLLTPPGTGAIGLIRVAGPDSERIFDRIFRPVGLRREAAFDGNRLRYGHLLDGDEVIDDVVVARVDSPEPVAIDISAHGGVRVVERILELLERQGAPLETANEVSITAWPVTTMIEREALEALGHAKTVRAARFAAWQRKHLADRITAVLPRDDQDVARATQRLAGMRERFRPARYLVDGATLAIVGPPNSGKSTLFNRLMGRQAAIVSPQAGTTRDWVQGEIEIEGVPISLIDTAGRHETGDSLERDAIARGTSIGRTADVQVLLVDGSRPLPKDVSALLVGSPGAICLPVVNKADLSAAWRVDELSERLDPDLPEPQVISAQNGDGLRALEQSIAASMGLLGWAEDTPALFTSRQYDIAGRILAGRRELASADFARGIDTLVGTFSDADG